MDCERCGSVTEVILDMGNGWDLIRCVKCGKLGFLEREVQKEEVQPVVRKRRKKKRPKVEVNP